MIYKFLRIAAFILFSNAFVNADWKGDALSAAKVAVENFSSGSIALIDSEESRQYLTLFKKLDQFIPDFGQTFNAIKNNFVMPSLYACMLGGVFFGIQTLYWAYVGSLEVGIIVSFIFYQMIALLIAKIYEDEKVDSDYVKTNAFKTAFGSGALLLYNNFGAIVIVGMIIAKVFLSDDIGALVNEEFYTTIIIAAATSIALILPSNFLFKPIFDFFMSYKSKFFFWIRSVIYGVFAMIMFKISFQIANQAAALRWADRNIQILVGLASLYLFTIVRPGSKI